MTPRTIDQTGADLTLPDAAYAELQRALALVAGGGGRLARGAAGLARMAALAAAPVSRAMGLAVGLRRRLGGPSTLQPVIAQMLERALDVATIALPHPMSLPRRAARARAAAIASGLAGGAAGLAGFLPDAAFSTMLMLRHIAAIAAREGEDLSTDAARQACIEVFTLGAPLSPAATGGADHAQPGHAQPGHEHESYWTARMLMQGAPLMALIRQAAARFGVAMSEKLAMQAVPFAGAAGGALVNAAFFDHYCALAEGHFIIRRLERTYGREIVRSAAGG
jgi:hypothetical protein